MNDLSASSRITYGAVPVQPAVVAPHPGPVGQGDRLALHHADDRAAAGDQHLPADLDDLSVVHQLPRQPAECAESSGWASTTTRRILTDPDIWAAMQATAHFVFWTDRASQT